MSHLKPVPFEPGQAHIAATQAMRDHAKGTLYTADALHARAIRLGDALAAAQECVDLLDEVRRRPQLAKDASFKLQAEEAITKHTHALAAYFAK